MEIPVAIVQLLCHFVGNDQNSLGLFFCVKFFCGKLKSFQNNFFNNGEKVTIPLFQNFKTASCKANSVLKPQPCCMGFECPSQQGLLFPYGSNSRGHFFRGTKYKEDSLVLCFKYEQ